MPKKTISLGLLHNSLGRQLTTNEKSILNNRLNLIGKELKDISNSAYHLLTYHLTHYGEAINHIANPPIPNFIPTWQNVAAVMAPLMNMKSYDGGVWTMSGFFISLLSLGHQALSGKFLQPLTIH